MEADFQSVYGLDLSGLWRGDFTFRRAAALAAHLPNGSAVWRVLNVDAAWDTNEYLLALTVDALNGANWQRGGGGGTQPKPVPRPAELRAQAATEDRVAAKADAFIRKQQAREARNT